MSMIDATTRVAIAALLHDLGKLAERAGIDHEGRLDAHKNLYCPWRNDGGYHTHIHAAYTGIAWDALERTGAFPDFRSQCEPFKKAVADGNLPDSLVNAAAAHHKPDTFLQWVIATADRVASGFEREEFETQYNNSKERENHYRARLLTLFEQIGKGGIKEGELMWNYPLRPLSPESIFPVQDAVPKTDDEARAEYHRLWDALVSGLEQIPGSHRSNLPLWLDHFDSLWLTVAHAIPAATAFGVKPEVSLYDHSKAAAALASALFRWHHENGDQEAASLKNGWDEEKFLLVQGDFFGIQNFIFSEGGQTNRHAHKLLRGRSFQVALLAECASLQLLDALQLPSTSQIVNAAGKFLIVAPNTEASRKAIEESRKLFNKWCLANTYGEIGIGLASTTATCNDFTRNRFGDLVRRLFEALDIEKHRRFDLSNPDTPAVFEGFLDKFDNELGVCAISGRYPAVNSRRGYPASQLADDQVSIGELLTKRSRVLVSRSPESLPTLGMDYFGWRIAFASEESTSGKYSQLAKQGTLVRCWDFDPPEADGTLFRGYARRFVNSYVPQFTAADEQTAEKYGRWEEEAEFDRQRPIKTLHHIACEDRALQHDGKWLGEVALVTLKGDIDNLGMIFQQGLSKPTFAKWASLSRQVNLFFAMWLPWFCEHGQDGQGIHRFQNTYTVFAGGDDFFLIGPWKSTIQLAGQLRCKFADYVVNDTITFSAGMSMTKPKVPARHLARSAEAALARSKGFDAGGERIKNAVTVWGQTVSWDEWLLLTGGRMESLYGLIDQAERHGAKLSSGMVYSILELSDRAQRETTRQYPEDSLWRSQLSYRVSRFFSDRIRSKGGEDVRDVRNKIYSLVVSELTDALVKHRGSYRIPLSLILYSRRN